MIAKSLNNSLSWNIQRNKTFERDINNCQKCQRTINLAVHHIIPYKFSKDNELINLITLCPKCHMTEENFYRQFKTPSLFIKRKMQEKYPNIELPYIRNR